MNKYSISKETHSIPFFADAETDYKIRLSASTLVGEGDKSIAVRVRTDRKTPSTPQMRGIDLECVGSKNSDSATVQIRWTSIEGHEPLKDLFYRVEIEDYTQKLGASGNIRRVESKSPWLIVDELRTNAQYLIRVASAIPSEFNNATIFQSAFSKNELFAVFKSKSIPSSPFHRKKT